MGLVHWDASRNERVLFLRDHPTCARILSSYLYTVNYNVQYNYAGSPTK